MIKFLHGVVFASIVCSTLTSAIVGCLRIYRKLLHIPQPGLDSTLFLLFLLLHHTPYPQSHFELILNVAQTFFNGKQHRRKKWTLKSCSHAKNNERIWVKFHFYTRLKLILKHPFYLFIISLGTYGSMLSSCFTYVNMLSAIELLCCCFCFCDSLNKMDACHSSV